MLLLDNIKVEFECQGYKAVQSQTSVFLCADKHIRIGFLTAIDIVSHFPLHK